MPTYVYRRPDGTLFEAFQKISAPALTADPDTGVPVQRVISGGAGLQFKGSGFYLTDYGRGGAAGKRDTSESSSDSKPAKTDTKSASPAEKAGSESTPAKTPSSTPSD